MVIENRYYPDKMPHPGLTLLEKLTEFGMGPREFAVRTTKPEKTIIAILKGKSSITSDMSIQFETVTKIPASYWMNHQQAYDEYVARIKHQQIIRAASNWAKKFPADEMIELGWIKSLSIKEDKTTALLSFFGFSSPIGWENYYINQQLKLAFSISLSQAKNPYALSAWLRQGELQATEIDANQFFLANLKSMLPKMKSLMDSNTEDYFTQLQIMCQHTGIKLIHTPNLRKAPIHGATRWILNNPFIQLSEITDKNGIFWFTFFHEIGHIVLHGKKEVFLEDIGQNYKDIIKEKEADAFALSMIKR